jgi:heme/copper-type cytochrome/quinol oxidase subunit 2
MLSAQRAAVAAAVLAMLALTSPLRAETQLEITLSDTGFTPAELTVPAGEPFTLLVHNTTAAAAEFESKDLRIEKIVAAGTDIVINVRAQDPGVYKFVDEFKEDTVFGHITIK